MDASGALPANNHELLRLCGFIDKDNNGVIVKRGIKPLQIRNEGYIEDADVDKDGQIIGTEVKLYYRIINNIHPLALGRVALSDADNKQLVLLFRKRLFELGNLTRKMSSDNAYDVNHRIKNDGLNDIAIKLSYCTIDKTTLRSLLNEIFFVARTFNDKDHLLGLITNIASLIQKNYSLDEAFIILKDSGLEDPILAYIANRLFEKKQYKDVLRCARKMADLNNRQSFLRRVAIETSNHALFNEAAAIAGDNPTLLSEIAGEARDINMYRKALDILDKNPTTDNNSDIAYQREREILSIAHKMAETGFLDDARNAVRGLRNEQLVRYDVYMTYEITDAPIIKNVRKLIKAGRTNEAFQEAKKIDDPLNRLQTFLWFAEYLSDNPSNNAMIITIYDEAIKACSRVYGSARYRYINTYDESIRDFDELRDYDDNDIRRHVIRMIVDSVKHSKIDKPSLSDLYRKTLALIGALHVEKNVERYGGIYGGRYGGSNRTLALINFIKVVPASKLPKDLSRGLFSGSIKIAKTVNGFWYSYDKMAFGEIDKAMQKCGFKTNERIQIWKEAGMKATLALDLMSAAARRRVGLHELLHKNEERYEILHIEYMDKSEK